jgi:hypothetical protein
VAQKNVKAQAAAYQAEKPGEREQLEEEIKRLADSSLIGSPLRRISHALGAMRVDGNRRALEVTLYQVDGENRHVNGLGEVVNVLTMESNRVGYLFRGDGVPPEEALPQLKAKLALVKSLNR